jgi:hypothetical protein
LKTSNTRPIALFIHIVNAKIMLDLYVYTISSLTPPNPSRQAASSQAPRGRITSTSERETANCQPLTSGRNLAREGAWLIETQQRFHQGEGWRPRGEQSPIAVARPFQDSLLTSTKKIRESQRKRNADLAIVDQVIEDWEDHRKTQYAATQSTSYEGKSWSGSGSHKASCAES